MFGRRSRMGRRPTRSTSTRVPSRGRPTRSTSTRVPTLGRMPTRSTGTPKAPTRTTRPPTATPKRGTPPTSSRPRRPLGVIKPGGRGIPKIPRTPVSTGRPKRTPVRGQQARRRMPLRGMRGIASRMRRG